jgi:hypothetical protein
MTNETNTPNTNAVDSFEALCKDTVKIAEVQGEGANSRAKWLVRIIRAAANGVIDTDTKVNVAGKPTDMAVYLYDLYVKSCGKKNTHGVKTVISKSSNIRTAIKMGVRTDIDPIAVMNNAIVVYEGLVDDKTIKQHPPFEAFNNVVKAQLASTSELTDAQLANAMTKEEAEHDVGYHLRAALKSMERAYGMDNCDKVTTAYEAVNNALTFINASAQMQEDMAQLQALQAKLGIAA